MSDAEQELPIRNLNRDEYERRKAEQARKERLEEKNKERALQGLAPLTENHPRPKPAEPKQLLNARSNKLKLDAALGKTQVVQEAGSSRQPGFYCEACDCTLKDSVSYVDHINGRKHQLNLGISLKVERSSLDQVKQKLAEMKQKREAPKQYDLDERVALAVKKEDEDRERKKKRKLERKLAKRSKSGETEVPDDEAAKIMGFGSFGSTK